MQKEAEVVCFDQMAVCGPVYCPVKTKRLPVSVGEASLVKATFTITSSGADSLKTDHINSETL